MKYGSVAAMVASLDRMEVAAARTRRMCKNMQRLSPSQRKFAYALKHVLETIPSAQGLHSELIMRRLKIDRAMYCKLLVEVDKCLS